MKFCTFLIHIFAVSSKPERKKKRKKKIIGSALDWIVIRPGYPPTKINCEKKNVQRQNAVKLILVKAVLFIFSSFTWQRQQIVWSEEVTVSGLQLQVYSHNQMQARDFPLA